MDYESWPGNNKGSKGFSGIDQMGVVASINLRAGQDPNHIP